LGTQGEIKKGEKKKRSKTKVVQNRGGKKGRRMKTKGKRSGMLRKKP